jgi:hypothetical protein
MKNFHTIATREEGPQKHYINNQPKVEERIREVLQTPNLFLKTI